MVDIATNYVGCGDYSPIPRLRAGAIRRDAYRCVWRCMCKIYTSYLLAFRLAGTVHFAVILLRGYSIAYSVGSES